ncbi:MAG: hypothetical protein M1133_05975 [Armatimonadetes bacterium]|nr:hypothetical protein [Armatimonadota bacterium]
MSIRSFTYLTRLLQAIFVLALCGILAASVSAQGRRDRSDRDSGRRGEARQQSGPRDNRSGRPDVRKGKPDTPRDAVRERRDLPGRRDHWERRDRPGSDNPRSGEWRNRRNGRDYRPESRPDNRDYRRTDRPPVYVPRRDYDRDNRDYREPRGYRPPAFRGGFYFYSSRPGNRPYHYGHWVFDNYDPGFCRRSVYFHFGIFPYIQIGRVRVLPYVRVSYYDRPIAINAVGLEIAMADIREAWLDGRPDLIDRHLSGSQRIAVLLDGRYDYSVDADDYNQMTSDAIDEVRTISFTWESVRQRTDGDFTAFGRHVFRDSSDIIRTLYVSYTLSRIGGDYVITEVGTSGSPLM